MSMEVSLCLRLEERERPTRADAWFIGNADPCSWLDEIARWGISMAALRLLVVPLSIRERSPRGVLVLVPDSAVPRVSPRSLPFTRFCESLYIPSQTRVDPAITEHEFTLHGTENLHVLLPPARLVGFGADEILRVTDLVSRPRHIRRAWDRAHPGTKSPGAIREIKRTRQEGSDEIFANAAHEIGNQSTDNLPEGPGEAGILRTTGYQITHGLTGALGAVADRIGGATDEETIEQSADGHEDDPRRKGLLGRMANWAHKKSRAIGEKLALNRLRELSRLTNLLESDPERGLRHAIPLREIGHRGLAPPNSRLGERTADFRLDRLRGGRPGDPWEIPDTLYSRLLHQYILAAQRELDLGHYRRAAYILAELLGDYDAAAHALVEGGHFREAAVLYRDFLRQPKEAAECLEEAGLYLEAIQLYEEVDEFTKIGDLWRRLDDQAKSERAYYRAVAKLSDSGDLIGAAALLEGALDSPDDAFSLLMAAWPDSVVASTCLREALDLVGRHGWHQEGGRIIRDLGRGTLPRHKREATARVLVEQSQQYPDESVRRLAEDTARVVLGRLLEESGEEKVDELARIVARLDPDDASLARDALRFAFSVKSRSVRKPQRPRQFVQLPSRGRLELPSTFRWVAFATVGEIFYAAGKSVLAGDPGIAFHRQTWDGRHTDLVWFLGLGVDSEGLIVAPDPLESGPTIGAIPAAQRRFQPILRKWPEVVFPSGPASVGMPPWLTEAPFGLCYRSDGIICALNLERSELTLNSYNANGDFLNRKPLFPVSSSDHVTGQPRSIVANGANVWFVWDGFVVLVKEDGAVQRFPCPNEPRRLVPLGDAVVVTCTRGLVILDENGLLLDTNGDVDVVAPDLVAPLATVVRGGFLVVLSGAGGRIYKLKARRGFKASPASPVEVGEFHAPDFGVVELLPLDEPLSFAVAGNGAVETFSLPIT